RPRLPRGAPATSTTNRRRPPPATRTTPPPAATSTTSLIRAPPAATSLRLIEAMNHEAASQLFPRVLVFADRPFDRYRCGRTCRAVARLARYVEEVCASTPAALASALLRWPGPVWLIRAGCWPASRSLDVPPASATGRPLCAFGLVRSPPGTSP